MKVDRPMHAADWVSLSKGMEDAVGWRVALWMAGEGGAVGGEVCVSAIVCG